jgi:hypothetical protein
MYRHEYVDGGWIWQFDRFAGHSNRRCEWGRGMQHLYDHNDLIGFIDSKSSSDRRRRGRLPYGRNTDRQHDAIFNVDGSYHFHALR